MPGRIDELSEEEIQELLDFLNESIDSHNGLIDLTTYFPSVSTIKLIQLLAKMKSVMEEFPPELWIDFINFIGCDSSAIINRNRQEILKMLELIEATLEAELVDLDGSGRPEEAIVEDSINEVRRVKDLVENMDDSVEDIARSIDEFDQLKRSIAALSILQSIYSSDLVDVVGEDALNPKIGKMIKAMVKKVVERVLIRVVGTAVAEKWIPYLGPILAGIETILYGGTLASISDLEGNINRLLCRLVSAFAAKGRSWPLHHPDVWVDPQKVLSQEFPAYIVIVENYVRCAYGEKGEDCEWGNRCKLKFETGLEHYFFPVTVPVVPIASIGGRIRDGILEYPNLVSYASVDDSRCLNPTNRNVVKAYTITKMTFIAVDPAVIPNIDFENFSGSDLARIRTSGNFVVTEFVNGVKVF